MKISIITVCFNAKETIEETFLSVFNQTYKNVELIVIDGGSVDGTLEIVEKYKDNISHFVSKPDNGIYDAMNKGIKLATGDFLLFLNADDVLYDNNVLEKVAKALDENSEIKFLFGDADYISEDKNGSKIQTYEKITNEFSLLSNNICHQSIFYYRSLFEKLGGYSKDYEIYADWDFNIKCLMKEKVAAMYLPIIISKFQSGGACSSSSTLNLCKTDRKILIDRYYKKYKFLIKLNLILKNNFGPLHKFLVKIFRINDITKSFTSKEVYKLNVKTY